MDKDKIKRLENLIPNLRSVDCIYKDDKSLLGEAIAYLTDYLDRLKTNDNKTT